MDKLIRGHRNEEIMVSDGPMQLYELPFINEVTLVDIIAAASAQTFPKTVKITAGISGQNATPQREYRVELIPSHGNSVETGIASPVPGTRGIF